MHGGARERYLQTCSNNNNSQTTTHNTLHSSQYTAIHSGIYPAMHPAIHPAIHQYPTHHTSIQQYNKLTLNAPCADLTARSARFGGILANVAAA